MKHIVFTQSENYRIAVLLKATSFNKQDIQANYVSPLNTLGISNASLIAFTLRYGDNGKASVKFIKEYLDKLLPAMNSLGITLLYVTDAAYFKTLTKQSKAEPHHGYVLPCAIKGYEHMNVVLGVNYQALIYNPALQDKLTMSLKTVADQFNGNYLALGTGIIHTAQYPESLQDIAAALESLHQYKELTCDIEGFSLRFNEAGIATIGFAWDQHNGLAFACDYISKDPGMHQGFGCQVVNSQVRALLLNFFTEYQGELTFHNATYDIKVIIYTLWMESLLDSMSCITGLEIMTRAFQDTKIIAYLATNSTAGNVLGLKALAHEFAGNWAQEDIKDIRRISLKDLLQYNLVDCLSTWFVKNKYTPIMVQDKQEELYRTLMLPSLKTIIQMELTGMPMDKTKIKEVKKNLELQQEIHLALIKNSPLIKVLNLLVQTSAMEAANAKLKVKQHPLDKFSNVTFNPNSGPQLQRLLYEQMGLPVLDYTDTKQPATGAETIEKLINHTKEPAYKELLTALISYGKVSKILSTFIPAFEHGLDKADGRKYLHGSFNLGGTVSGRLSSSEPNMQNLPSKSTFSKLVKSCFSAPDGWLFVGADFNSLEDMISALTTKDRNKIKVYTDGYCGHCLRAFSYFSDQCPDIIDTVESINSIKKLYPDLRQESKGPTFALTYQGTWHTLVNNLGFDKDKAQAIEKGYHALYEESDQYVQNRLQQASKDGFVEVAFGLRVRTPLLKQVVFGTDSVPYEAKAEGRTAGNALGQSYGLLNNRAMNTFMEKVRASKYRLDILPVGQIHDAGYYLIRDDADVMHFANQGITEAMAWQELPEIQHPRVKLGAQLDIFWPDWAHSVTLPTTATKEEIINICATAKENHLKELK